MIDFTFKAERGNMPLVVGPCSRSDENSGSCHQEADGCHTGF